MNTQSTNAPFSGFQAQSAPPFATTAYPTNGYPMPEYPQQFTELQWNNNYNDWLEKQAPNATPGIFTNAPTNPITSVVRFTGIPVNYQERPQMRKTKRKSLESDSRPAKVLITDQKMADSLNQMHISANFVSPIENREVICQDNDMEELNNNDDVSSPETRFRLVMSDELLQLNNNNNNWPNMIPLPKDDAKALVLWRPPPLHYFNEKGEEEEDGKCGVIITDVTDAIDEDVDISIASSATNYDGDFEMEIEM